MPLLSIEFALFFLIFFPLYWAVGKSPAAQNWLLLAAGLGWLSHLAPLFTVAVVIFSLFIHLTAKAVAGGSKIALAIGIVGTLLNLAFFKYYDFFRPQLESLLGQTTADFLLPLGISYYSFQAVSYLCTLYHKPHMRLTWDDLLLHFSFFPSITAGPIARIDSFSQGKAFYWGMKEQINPGLPRTLIAPHWALALIVSGLAKKWWIAGSVAEHFVNPVFANPSQYDGGNMLLAVYGYTFQLFFDFSGYSDLAVGIAMLLGFRLPQNFNMPLIAYNLKDFWKRWHISLSTWIRDYIYIPLGGNRKGFWRAQLYLFTAMTLSGIWHGYGLNFLVWGLLHAGGSVLLNVAERYSGGWRLSAVPFVGKPLAVFFTFNFVALAFVIFRTGSFEETLFIYQTLLGQNWHFDRYTMTALASVAAGLLLYRPWARGWEKAVEGCGRLPLPLWGVILTSILLVVILFAPSGIPNFIYANF